MEREKFAVVTAASCFLYGAWQEEGRQIEDEVFSGWALRVFPGETPEGWIKAETHYGYPGYVRREALRMMEREELCARQQKARFLRIGIREADLLSCPKVQGLPQELLLQNAFVELLAWEETKGYSRIRTASGKEGYVHSRYLAKRLEDDGYLLAEEAGERGDYFQNLFLRCPFEEESLRERVCTSARAYLGAQYRWGGKSVQGLDCSGLVFMSYLENGVLIYRDARLQKGYPVHEISCERLKKGDLIFFPGHVAMYLGAGDYIHSTAFCRTPFVTINSLDPSKEHYRADLAEKITGYGSVFGGSGGQAAFMPGGACVSRHVSLPNNSVQTPGRAVPPDLL